jgi:hypothetical protein
MTGGTGIGKLDACPPEITEGTEITVVRRDAEKRRNGRLT